MTVPYLPPDHPAVEAAAQAIAHQVGDTEPDDQAFDLAYTALQAAATWMLSPAIAPPMDPGRGSHLQWAMRQKSPVSEGARSRLMLAQIELDHWDAQRDGTRAQDVIARITPLLHGL